MWIVKKTYKTKRQATYDLARYYLDCTDERDKLVSKLKSMDLGIDRVAAREEIEKSLWFKAYSIAYTRRVARVATTMMIDEVVWR